MVRARWPSAGWTGGGRALSVRDAALGRL